MPDIYIQLKNKVLIEKDKQSIYVQDVARIAAPNPCIVSKIKVYTLTNDDKDIIVISAIDIVKKIQNALPDHTVNIVGADNIVVEKIRQQKNVSVILVAIAWILLYFGAGLTIMYFHEDTSMKEVHQRLHYLLTGEESDTPYWIQIPYSLGIGIGMMVFFNNVFKKKINEEPSPLEVEMFLYDDNINKYLVKKPKLNKKDDA
ncbi:stage V sporulation protein AA [Desulfuribacillus alkaliarsenatis]|uniref:Stage V sporulation protein AA domain-containing protein n=1 Tax=Desulfuribacillus alkaliarsenatis TaxID=766136 RepID=A0A1E5G5Q5_9FIRM|nr:stage V sporulation protein AA [Desulfuribacillus alkaliarsenatis]OEF98483.1 hypothetical protein BHF68_02065 [Desulfuribacillus alkaliarsenatis]